MRDGPNIPLNLAADEDVKFYYDDGTHWVTDDHNSVIAVAPGSFQSELGCASDWDPSCLRSWLQDPDGDGVGRFSTTALPPGDYESKVAIDEAWTENYGAGGIPDGPNIVFSVMHHGDVVTFAYDQTTPRPRHRRSRRRSRSTTPRSSASRCATRSRTRSCTSRSPTASTTATPRTTAAPTHGPCVADDTQENVLTHGYLPSDKGYYHGGDIAGLRERLPYLEGLGISAIWVGPIFREQDRSSRTPRTSTGIRPGTTATGSSTTCTSIRISGRTRSSPPSWTRRMPAA